MAEKRRTISDALSLTPEKIAFIHDGSEQTEDRNPAISNHQVESNARQDANLSVLPPTLVPLTSRLLPETAAALKRAYLERKLAGQPNITQQEIVEEALQQWLTQNGHLDGKQS